MVDRGRGGVEALVLLDDVLGDAVLGVLGWNATELCGIPCVGPLMRRRPVVAEKRGEETPCLTAFLLCRLSRKDFCGVYTGVTLSGTVKRRGEWGFVPALPVH